MTRLLCRLFGHCVRARLTVSAHVRADGRTVTAYGVRVACLWCGKKPR